MTFVPSGRSLLANGGRALALPLCFLILTACSAEADNPTPDAPAAAQVISGILLTADGRYEFTPKVCGVHREGDIDDIEVAGPGIAPDGEKFYFSLSSTGNEITLQLGADGPYTRSGRELRAGQYVSRAFTVDVSGRKFAVNNLALVDETGQTIDDSATLKITCGV